MTVVPYRPYVYRPHFGLGVYYGAGGAYPYGVTPRGYYDPLQGRYYGGLRITGAPRDAQVFADGYYVGIVDDFDGIFQHVNLEAGPHHIEIQSPGRTTRWPSELLGCEKTLAAAYGTAMISAASPPSATSVASLTRRLLDDRGANLIAPPPFDSGQEHAPRLAARLSIGSRRAKPEPGTLAKG